MTGWCQAVAVIVIVGVLHVPLGDYLARVYGSSRHLRAERALYRLIGVAPDEDQRWTRYLGSVLAFSAMGVLLLYGLLRLQTYLPRPWGHQGMDPALAFNTAVSFTTNTSWQNYAGESALGHLGLAAGLGVEAFASAAVGMCVAVALVRGLARRETDRLGNFWVDLTRSCVRILLPLSLLFGVVFVGLGVVQNFSGGLDVAALAGGHQTILGGPVASWEPIKLISGDGGGAFNANSAHPFENPGPVANLIEIVLMLLIPTAFIRMFGRMIGDRRQGWALLVVAAVLFAAGMVAMGAAETVHHGTVAAAAGSAAEGTETRFGLPASALFGQAATASADGATNSSYDSFASLGGGMLLANMMLGEVSPGGAGSGLYGLLIMAMVAVFLGGLMIGRTPEYLKKRLGGREMKFISLYVFVAPLAILIGTGIAMGLTGERKQMGNTGPHGLSEVLYAFTSSAASNGSAFGGFSGNTTWYNVALALTMLLGRYLPMIFVLALAGSLAAQRPGVVTAGTLRTHSPVFVGLLVATILIVVGLEYFPALALGPLAEGVH
ncbi:MAG TPA: potassium-transporting ATPase subunit KdpA [Streptosporangiaceae bacterium]|nr:potassium-transporting ATPase subunit KdpA [Streptosporangiaceae bacterium]